MVKAITMLTLVLVLATGSAFAGAHPGGIAREIALGGGPLNPSGTGPNLILNPFVHDDPTIMLLNPAYQGMYRDYAWMNIGGGTLNGMTTGDNGYGSQFAGVNFAYGKELAFGANLSFDPSFTNFLASQLQGYVNGVSGRASQGIPPPIDVFEVVASYDMGSMDLGFAFMYGWSSNTFKGSSTPPAASADNELSARVMGFRAGIVWDLGGGTSFDLDAAIRLDKATDKLSQSPAPAATPLGEYSISATEIQIDGRFKLKMSNKVNFVPYATFVTISAEPKQDTPPTPTSTATLPSFKLSAMMLSVGAGMEYKINNFYFAGGVSYKTANYKQERTAAAPATNSSKTTTSMTGLPVINLGIEWTLTDWLTGRMGYYRAFQSNTTKNEASNPAVNSSSESETSLWFGNSNAPYGGGYGGPDNSLITLGLGLKFGNFALDGTVSEEALRRGLGLIGAQDNINTFGYLTASYCFE